MQLRMKVRADAHALPPDMVMTCVLGFSWSCNPFNVHSTVQAVTKYLEGNQASHQLINGHILDLWEILEAFLYLITTGAKHVCDCLDMQCCAGLHFAYLRQAMQQL